MKPVFVDVDTGVDDAIALVYLLASPDADVVGIASTGGNVAVDQVCENNLGLLELCGATDIPVSKGAQQPLNCSLLSGKAHGPRGMGYADLPASNRRLTSYDSATAWVRAAHAHTGELIGVVDITSPLRANHPHTLASMHNLANTYDALGRRAEALELREATLALRKAKLGPDHPDTLMSMCGLAYSY